MNLDYWRGFLMTAQTGSISRASDKLTLTPPALGKQIRALESYYGVTLFVRTTTGVQLTAEGRLLLDTLQPIMKAHECLEERLRAMGDNRTSLSIGTLPSLAQRYVPSAVLKLQNQGYRVNITVGNTSEQVYDMLEAGDIDLAVAERSALPPSAWSAELVREKFYLLLPADHRMAGIGNSGPEPEELSKVPLVVHPPSCSIRRTIEKGLAERGFGLSVGKQIDFGESLDAYVAAGAGAAIVPLRSAEQVIDGRLRAVPLRNPAWERVVILAARSAQEGKPMLRTFVSVFR